MSPGLGTKSDYEQRASVQTTDATVTVIDTIPIPTDESVGLRIDVTAIKNDGTKALDLSRKATFANDGGTVSLIGTETNSHFERQDVNMDVTLVISGTNVQVKVTGVAATTIDWLSTVRQIL